MSEMTVQINWAGKPNAEEVKITYRQYRDLTQAMDRKWPTFELKLDSHVRLISVPNVLQLLVSQDDMERYLFQMEKEDCNRCWDLGRDCDRHR